MDRCRRGGGAARAAGDDRVEAVELLVGVEVDDQAPAAPRALDADPGGEHAAQLRLQVLEVGAELPALRTRTLLALAADQLLRLAHREAAPEHDGQHRALELGNGDRRQPATVTF